MYNPQQSLEATTLHIPIGLDALSRLQNEMKQKTSSIHHRLKEFDAQNGRNRKGPSF